jgi:hypothetical protein
MYLNHRYSKTERLIFPRHDNSDCFPQEVTRAPLQIGLSVQSNHEFSKLRHTHTGQSNGGKCITQIYRFVHIKISTSACTHTVCLLLSVTQPCYRLSTLLWKRLLFFRTSVPVTFCYNSSLHYRPTNICLPMKWRIPYMRVSNVCLNSFASWISWGMWRSIVGATGHAV